MEYLKKNQSGSIAIQIIDSVPISKEEEAEIVGRLIRETGSLSAGVEREMIIEINGHIVRVKTTTTIEIR